MPSSPALNGRDRVLVEATRLFAARGVAGTSLQAVADAAGMQKPSLLYHFPRKEILREAVLDELLSRWKEEIPRVLGAAQSGRDRFRGAFGAIVSFFEEDADRARLLARECLDRPVEMRARLAAELQPWSGLVSELLRLGQAEGRVRPDVDVEAWMNEVVVLATAHFAFGTVTPGFGSASDGLDRERRNAELIRMAGVSLFRERRPEEEA